MPLDEIALLTEKQLRAIYIRMIGLDHIIEADEEVKKKDKTKYGYEKFPFW